MAPDGSFLDFYTQLLTAGEVAERMAATIAKYEKELARAPKTQ
jgi:hypothetical protein